ncbi:MULTISPECIES: N-acetylmannosamine-6-phosphate 2-epimerase [unclassified Paenibacillus]|uniref:N-acetylmannosamine-6-phosphate 2-epimerase n=1 Tax=unclassified Paenibacillus TaxID=185978 RepID=UPI001C109D8F|nr:MULTISPECIES: N-acetylmannosamine-6-phosphate 2-epimerase [unclassified Paenibacillus]MBU5442856.1 N-acetylmannosamine-6-phosphate 2-epimerase [Paenibacillus sp. MSJ-34]CAH0119234.1 Putative N-acetylmannosamine-6-phosphate 2-epimerase [Paenibacillus sp. CECT 9249]
MNIHEFKRGLIVSCQAQPDEPFFGSDYMAKMAVAAEMGGAIGVRVNTVPDIVAVRKAVSIPVIGIIKRQYPDCYPYITPTIREVQEVADTGADIVAVDATKLLKPDGKTTEQFIHHIKERFDLLVMADVSTAEEGVAAWKAGADIVATTLAGYTEYTREKSDLPMELREPNFDIISELADRIEVPVVAEGRFWDYRNAVKAMSLGAYSVVIGAGITRPQIITQKNVMEINRYLTSLRSI